MRILYVINTGLIGGLQRHVLCLMQCLCAQGERVNGPSAEVAVAINAVTDPRVVEMFEKEGLKVYLLGGKSGHDLRVVGRFKKVLEDFNPDVIHAHGLPIVVGLWMLLGGKRCPVVHSIHTPSGKPTLKGRLERFVWDHVVDYWLPVSGPTWAMFKRWHPNAKGEVFFNPLRMERAGAAEGRGGVLLTPAFSGRGADIALGECSAPASRLGDVGQPEKLPRHTPPRPSALPRQPSPAAQEKTLLSPQFGCENGGVRASADVAAGGLLNANLRDVGEAPTRQTKEAYTKVQPLNTNHQPLTTNHQPPTTNFIVGMVGRAADQKDWPSFHAVAALVGERVKGVEFLNAGEEKVCNGREAIAKMDLFMMTSKHEQLPTTVLECFALGTPICGFIPDGGTTDILQFSTGPVRDAFIQERSCEKLADIVLDLLAHPEKRAALVADGRQILENHFDAEKLCKGQLMEVYERLVVGG